ncbi:hypothetical protein Tco_0454522 [Tanacetum coccineum]
MIIISPQTHQNRSAFYDDDDILNIQYKEYLENLSNAITPVLPIEEPDKSLSMGDEHLDTILETESNEVIKSSIEDLVPIPSESEGILNMCDVPSCDKKHFDAESDLRESLLNYDTSIIYSPKIDSLLEEFAGELAPIDPIPPGINKAGRSEEDFDPEDRETNTDILLKIKDDILREKLWNINLLIAKIEALNDNPTPDCVLNYHTEETSSGSTTTHADNSLPEYDSFLFEIKPDQGPVAYKLDLPEELDGVHDTFNVLNLKKCLVDPTLQVPLDEIQVEAKLNYVEEPVEILKREFKKLKRSRISIVEILYRVDGGDFVKDYVAYRIYVRSVPLLLAFACSQLGALVIAGRRVAESRRWGTGEQVGRGRRGRGPRGGNDERVDELNGQGNGQGLRANRNVEGVNGNVEGVNGSVKGATDFSTIIAQQLQNLLPAILAQVGNQGNVRNQNGNVVNENVQENVRNVLVNGNRVGSSYKEFLACNPKEYDGKGGAVVLTCWIKKMESVQEMNDGKGYL